MWRPFRPRRDRGDFIAPPAFELGVEVLLCLLRRWAVGLSTVVSGGGGCGVGGGGGCFGLITGSAGIANFSAFGLSFSPAQPSCDGGTVMLVKLSVLFFGDG